MGVSLEEKNSNTFLIHKRRAEWRGEERGRVRRGEGRRGNEWERKKSERVSEGVKGKKKYLKTSVEEKKGE